MSNVLGIEIPVKGQSSGDAKKVYLAYEGENAKLIRTLKAKGVDVQSLVITFLKKVIETMDAASPQASPQAIQNKK